ncbi:Protein spaetzle [Ooceraea biroi]|uniref:Protein spaetzle n=1 Tax=Ooceraea biroi TaxID=2015173 RepID=A0A026W760_OOCBI|nr:Protein spaetzle [Ooceraea biroi]
MTPRALWKACLAFILVCQTARRVGGHPRRPSAPEAEDAVMQDLISTAYENGELLRSEQWRWDESDEDDGGAGRPVQRDASKQGTVTSDETSVSSRPRDGAQGEQRASWEASSTGTSMQSDDNIIFPTDRRFVPSPTSVCENSTYCEEVSNYPRQLVNAAIARNASLRFLGSIDPLSDIEQRIDSADDSPLCRYREQMIYPQSAKNKENQWLFVVNQDNLKQGIRIEVCMNDGQECSMIQDFAEGYKTSCKQKYIYRELAAVGSDGNVIKDSFRFPSSCCCHVKFVGDPQLRLRFGLRYNQTTSATTRSSQRGM